MFKYIFIEEDAIKKIGDVLKKLDLNKGLLLADDFTIKIADKIDIDADKEIVNSIDIKDLEKLVEKTKNYEFVLGIGGGRVIDIAKYSSYKANKYFISVPTAASHDGIASGRASLNIEGKKMSVETRPPIAIIADLNVIKSAPFQLTRSGFADILANITAVADWRLSNSVTGEEINDKIAAMSLLGAETVINSAEQIKNLDSSGLKALMIALIDSSITMALQGSSRPASGSEHLFSHTLDNLCTEKKSLHGEQCGLGTIISAYLHGLDWKFIRERLKYMNCPTNAKEIGIPEEIILNALVTAKNIRPERYTIFSNLVEKKAKQTLVETNIIVG